MTASNRHRTLARAAAAGGRLVATCCSLLAMVACGGDEPSSPRFDDDGLSPLPSGDAGALAPLEDSAPPREYEEIALSSVPFVVVSNGDRPVEKDRSTGEAPAGDGAIISVGGTTYDSGLGVHSLSDLTFPLQGRYARFISDVGVDDEVPVGTGAIAFEVYVDDTLVFESGVVRRGSGVKTVNVSVAGANELRLVVTDGGDGPSYDHGDWAGARLLK